MPRAVPSFISLFGDFLTFLSNAHLHKLDLLPKELSLNVGKIDIIIQYHAFQHKQHKPATIKSTWEGA